MSQLDKGVLGRMLAFIVPQLISDSMTAQGEYLSVRIGPYVIGRGEKIRTSDPLHPMESVAKRDESLCHALNHLICSQIPCFLAFRSLFRLRVVS
jgi:hypothetical protein